MRRTKVVVNNVYNTTDGMEFSTTETVEMQMCRCCYDGECPMKFHIESDPSRSGPVNSDPAAEVNSPAPPPNTEPGKEKKRITLEEIISKYRNPPKAEVDELKLHPGIPFDQLMTEPSIRQETSRVSSSVKEGLECPSSSSMGTRDIEGSRKMGPSSDNPAKSSGASIPSIPCTIGHEGGCCEEQEHYEFDGHSHVCVDGMPPDASCDCCRHGHTLSSLIRPDDCKSCLRQMGGSHVSPKYPQMRQRMLKTLNLRRDNSEETELKNVITSNNKSSAKKEVITVNSRPATEDVDALVRMIEGIQVTADPKKAAKKARQKERKIDEERKREDEERRKREDEERLRKEKEQQEEEERRKVEEQKRFARKAKKKNRKKRIAVTSEKSKSTSSSEIVTGHSLQISASDMMLRGNDMSPNVNIIRGNATVSATAPEGFKQNAVPQSTDKKSEMVTIRRHPSQPESVVTISLKGKHGGEDLLYYLINGQIYRNDSVNATAKSVETEEETTAARTKRKKKKKSKLANEENSQQCSNCDTESVEVVENERPSSSNHYSYPEKDAKNAAELIQLKLPPGITITKVNSVVEKGSSNKVNESLSSVPDHCSVKESFTTAPENSHTGSDSTSALLIGDSSQVNQRMIDDDVFGNTENEEFEEVVSSKTRRKRNKAAKTKEIDGAEDQESIRSSPCSGMSTSFSSRRVLSCDKVVENLVSKRCTTVKAAPPSKSGKGKSTRNNIKFANGIDKCPMSSGRRDRSSDIYHGSMTAGANVMPRIARAHAKNVESTNRATISIDGQFCPHVTVEPSPALGGSMNRRERVENGGYISQSPTCLASVNQDPCHVNNRPIRPNEMSEPMLDPLSIAMANNILHSVSQTVVQPGLKGWDQGDKNSQPLGPYTRQADSKEDSWSPWKDYSWTEGSTPENPSPRFGMESANFSPQDASSTSLTFQELKRMQAGKSPIQRPVPTAADLLEMIAHRDELIHHSSSGYSYNSSNLHSLLPTSRSHSNSNDIHFQRSLLKESPNILIHPSNEIGYRSPEDQSRMNVGDTIPLSSSIFQRHESACPDRDENAKFGCSVNPFDGRLEDSSFRRPQCSTPEFCHTAAKQNSISHKNQQWNTFSGNNVPPQESELIYSQRQLNSSSSSSTYPSPLNNMSISDALEWMAEQRRLGTLNSAQSYDGLPSNQITHQSQSGAGHLNPLVSPRNPEVSSSERINWENGAAQYLQDFTSGAHQ